MFFGQSIFKNGNMLFCPILIIYGYTYNIAYRDGHGKTMCVYTYTYFYTFCKYIYAYIHTYIHTYIQTYRPTDL